MLPTPLHLLAERAHHFIWAIAAVVIVIVLVFFGPRHTVREVAGVKPAVPAPGSFQRELEVAIAVGKQVAGSHGTVPLLERPAVTVVSGLTNGAFSPQAYAAWLSALGTQRTAPSYHVSLVAPTPIPISTLPPSVLPEYADWHNTSTYNATALAIKNATLNVHVTQDPLPPSRTQTLFLSDKTAGIAYAVRRRGLLDLDIGITQGAGKTEGFAGPCLRAKNTSAGVCLGATLGSTLKPGIAAGLTVSF